MQHLKLKDLDYILWWLANFTLAIDEMDSTKSKELIDLT
jgi:hypothetical protein